MKKLLLIFSLLLAVPAHAETLVVAGGCFWGVEAVFEHVKGVSKAVSGYAGGSAETANYEQVSDGNTGHAESVEITYDPKVVSLNQLLDVYFNVAHDPTQLNFQGPDRGTQYRSQVFTSNPEQEKAVKDKIAELTKAKRYSDKIVTKVESLKAFYPAEDYHQNYLPRNMTSPYIIMHDLPKLAKLRLTYPDLYKP
ncbi:MAG: peptide-methionine (S)-S-oxide reductase MsrA [Alphaproteobacteria bacterium]|nr:peptide-methionine (S)-S-oxide reductase MsrA [Alphaproteobacteria bacterium]